MKRARDSLAAAILVVAGACSSDGPMNGTDPTWVGTITTEGNVTTVINESGSVWGGPGRLVEELSIGVETGAEEYMFDQTTFVYADERMIYVSQPGVPVVHTYDVEGTYQRDLGRPGQGPGEYGEPVHVASSDERVFVVDGRGDRIYAYTLGGEGAGTWTLRELACCAWPLGMSIEGIVRAPVARWDVDEMGATPHFGAQPFGKDGPQGSVLWVPEIPYEPLMISVQGRDQEGVPFAPTLRWTVAPNGIIAGVSDQYRFELHDADGTTTVVHRYWEPVPVHPDHAAWQRKYALAQIRATVPDWNWQGDEPPDHQPAFDYFIMPVSGEIWVWRPGPSRSLPDCIEEPAEDPRGARSQPCWRSETILDVFGRDGRYLGQVEPPAGLRPAPSNPYVRGDRLYAVIEDEAGTIMVKRYRLVLPGER